MEKRRLNDENEIMLDKKNEEKQQNRREKSAKTEHNEKN